MTQLPVIDGSYFIINAGAYLASDGDGATASLQTLRGTGTSFQIWAIGITPAGYMIRNFGTNGFLVPDGAGSVTTQFLPYYWLLPPNSLVPGSYSIQDFKNTTSVLGTTAGAQGASPSIAYEAQSATDTTQGWTFQVTLPYSPI